MRHIGLRQLVVADGVKQRFGDHDLWWVLSGGVSSVGILIWVWTNGPIPIMAPWDVFILLDEARCIAPGQIPHTRVVLSRVVDQRGRSYPEPQSDGNESTLKWE